MDEFAAKFRTLTKQESVDCSLIEFRIMDLADENPELRLNDLGAERWVFQQGIGRLAKRLCEKGLIELRRNRKDGRAKNIILTEQGKAVRAKCREILQTIL